MAKRYLVVGDIHAPFANIKTITRIMELTKALGPFDYVIQIGDSYDFFSQAKWAKTNQLMTGAEEIKEGRAMLVNFWQAIQKANKRKGKYYQLTGNHCARPYKRLLDKAPELEPFFSYEQFFKYPGVKTIMNYKQELILNGICFMHGYRTKLGDHARFNLMPTVCGHTHKGGTVFFPHRGKMLWELNAGFCADATSVPLSYALQTISKQTQGCGIIDEYGPRFIPF